MSLSPTTRPVTLAVGWETMVAFHPLLQTASYGVIHPMKINGVGSSPIVTYSDIQGGYEGTGNIDADPLLGTLQDNGGFVWTYALNAGSPAIDAGNPDPATCPSTDARGVARPIDGDGDGTSLCDMGSYEYKYPTSWLYLPLVGK